MYPAIWRALPGPRWFKVLTAAVLIVAVVAVLFEWVFPWAAEELNLLDPNIDAGG